MPGRRKGERNPLLNEEINEKSINLAVRVGQLTADELKKAIEKLLADLKNGEYPAKALLSAINPAKKRRN